MPSWDDHLRQLGRVTVRDRARIDRAGAHTDPDRPTVVTHWQALRAPEDAERWGLGDAPA